MHIAIIGNGISGITAARTIRKKDSECIITVVSAETKYFFSRTAIMYIYMGHMKYNHTKPYEDYFWEKNRINLIQDYVSQVDFENQELKLNQNGTLFYDKLLLATGSKSNKFGWPGQNLDGVQGLYSFQDLEKLERNTHKVFTKKSEQRVKKAIIVGGGLIGVELAEMLLSRNISVSFLIRENRFWGNILPIEEGNFIGNHLKEHGVEILYNTELKEITADESGRVKSIITVEDKEISCEFVGLTPGVSPNVDFLKDGQLEINRGIIVNRKLETNKRNVFAAGDCVEFTEPPPGRRSIEQVWYTGRMMGEVAGKNILGENIDYSPGPWFNSAKFFDIEYQTYGMVSNDLKEGEEAFYWENNNGKKAIKIVQNKNNKQLIGLNVFGIRLRHEIMDEILRSNKLAVYCLENWNKIVFDPEFYRNDIDDILDQYNALYNTSIQKPIKTWLERLVS